MQVSPYPTPSRTSDSTPPPATYPGPSKPRPLPHRETLDDVLHRIVQLVQDDDCVSSWDHEGAFGNRRAPVIPALSDPGTCPAC